MLLMALGTDPAAGSVPAAAVRGFLLEHLRECEGTVADDPAVRRLLASASGDAVALVDVDAVPVATLEGAERYAPGSGATGSSGSSGSTGSA